MPATALRCRICEAQYELEGVGTCSRCFGPLDPVYDWDEVERSFTPEAIAAGDASIWRSEIPMRFCGNCIRKEFPTTKWC